MSRPCTSLMFAHPKIFKGMYWRQSCVARNLLLQAVYNYLKEGSVFILYDVYDLAVQ